jgi:hypothetical protein
MLASTPEPPLSKGRILAALPQQDQNRPPAELEAVSLTHDQELSPFGPPPGKVGLLKTLIGLIRNGESHKRRTSRWVSVDYQLCAREVLIEKARKGLLKKVSRRALAKMLRAYQAKLETHVNGELLVELDLLGKIEEFREVFRRGADPEAYLRRTIANYGVFMTDAVTKARKEIEEL